MTELEIPPSLNPQSEEELRPPTSLYVFFLVVGLVAVGVLVSSFSAPQWTSRLIMGGVLLSVCALGILGLTGPSSWPGRCLAGMFATVFLFNAWAQAYWFEDSPREENLIGSLIVAATALRYALLPSRRGDT